MLVVQGLDGTAAPPSNGHALRAVGERAQVVDIPEAGHFLQLEQPELVFEAVFNALTSDQR